MLVPYFFTVSVLWVDMHGRTHAHTHDDTFTIDASDPMRPEDIYNHIKGVVEGLGKIPPGSYAIMNIDWWPNHPGVELPPGH